jgi:antitoxin ParD1/3/4
METYKTYITIENLERVAISQKLKALFKKTQSLPEISTITDTDIEAEISAYRQGH